MLFCNLGEVLILQWRFYPILDLIVSSTLHQSFSLKHYYFWASTFRCKMQRRKERGTETISPLRDDVAAACEDGRLFGTFFSALSVYHCWQRRSYRTRLFWAHCAMWRKLKTRGMILIDKNEWLVIFPRFTQEQAPHGNNSIDCKVYFLQNVVPDPLRPALLRIDVQDGTRAALMFHAQKW